MIKTQTEYYHTTPTRYGVTITVNEDTLLSFDELQIQLKPDVPDVWMSPIDYKSYLAESIVAIIEIEKLYEKTERLYGKDTDN